MDRADQRRVLSNMSFLKALTQRIEIKDPSQDVHSSIQLNSFGTYATPSLGERAGMDIHLCKYTIAPNSNYYRLWRSLLIILVICSAWMAPFELAFIRYLPRMFFLIDTIVDLIFLIDIVVTFFIPYMDKRKFILVDSISDIAIRYISTWFIFDIASSIPYQLFAFLITKRVGRGFAYNLLSMFRLWRLRRVSNMFSRLEKDIRVNYFRIRCLKLMGFALLSIHIMGCIWYLLAERYHNPKQTWIGVHLQDFKQESIGKRYVYAMFWSMITTASLGYGSLPAVNPVERLYTILCMFYKSGLAAYLIGNMADLAVDITRRTHKFRISVEAVSRFAIQNHLPSSLRDQMMNYMSLKFKTESLQQEEIMSMLPRAMRTSICQHLFSPTLKKAYLFRGTSNDFILQLIAEIRAEYFQPGEDIILHHEAPTEFYIVVSGKVELLIYKDAEEQHHGLAREGDVIGEIGALCCMPQPVIARSKSVSQVLRINRSCFLNVIRGNTADGQIVIYNLFEHLEGFKSLSLRFPKKIESLMSNFGIKAPSNL
ncbi:hypothetical protein KP509_37G041000 [Ceratopteris richardii]|uniref:Cyclic nucleotide-binding domain-containing protein n=1 Tax=Ceratopteris richardii TaxID=49495 RepID=A0A8T2Q8H8_CERRI|nr:hypothetical protein KP509_37G041000 [Ceratopteris richardii]KAH7279863.1 hypothetical protein KP509_37G041000 [Ceratopteris richardii]